jgi:hypothetical protein
LGSLLDAMTKIASYRDATGSKEWIGLLFKVGLVAGLEYI